MVLVKLRDRWMQCLLPGEQVSRIRLSPIFYTKALPVLKYEDTLIPAVVFRFLPSPPSSNYNTSRERETAGQMTLRKVALQRCSLSPSPSLLLLLILLILLLWGGRTEINYMAAVAAWQLQGACGRDAILG